MAAVNRPIPPLASCRNCGAEFRWFVPVRCPLCGTPMLRLVGPEDKPIRHLTAVKKGEAS